MVVFSKDWVLDHCKDNLLSVRVNLDVDFGEVSNSEKSSILRNYALEIDSM